MANIIGGSACFLLGALVFGLGACATTAGTEDSDIASSVTKTPASTASRKELGVEVWESTVKDSETVINGRDASGQSIVEVHDARKQAAGERRLRYSIRRGNVTATLKVLAVSGEGNGRFALENQIAEKPELQRAAELLKSDLENAPAQARERASLTGSSLRPMDGTPDLTSNEVQCDDHNLVCPNEGFTGLTSCTGSTVSLVIACPKSLIVDSATDVVDAILTGDNPIDAAQEGWNGCVDRWWESMWKCDTGMECNRCTPQPSLDCYRQCNRDYNWAEHEYAPCVYECMGWR